MSEDKRTLRESIQYLAGTHDNNPIILADANVVAYDIPSRTCTVTLVDGDKPVTRDDVRLMSSVDDGLLILPTVGSTVTIIFNTFTQPIVIGYSGFDIFVLNGGDLGGLVILGTALKSYNQLENSINTLKQLLTSWTPVTGDGGAALKAVISDWAGQQLNVTQQTDLENTAITQG